MHKREEDNTPKHNAACPARAGDDRRADEKEKAVCIERPLY